MRRLIFLLACAGSLLVFPETGGAKEIVKKAEACGSSGCRAEVRHPDRDLPFELIGPTIQTGRRVPPPPRAATEPSFTVTLHTRPGRNVISARYLPGPGFLRAKAERGRIFVPRRWVRLTEDEVSAYAWLTDGLAPFGADQPAIGATRGGPRLGPMSLVAVRGLLALI
jgi:hypothetical protein